MSRKILVSALCVVVFAASAFASGARLEIISLRHESTELYRLVGEYPQCDGLEEFNRGIRDAVESRLAAFKKECRENWDARQAALSPGPAKGEHPAEPPCYFGVSWVPKQINGDFISILVRFDIFSAGANMSNDFESFNYDVKNKRSLELADLFTGEPDVLSRVSGFARERLGASLAAAGMKTDLLEAGTEPKPENFRNFVFDEDTITFYFPECRVAPCAAGPQEVMMPNVGICGSVPEGLDAHDDAGHSMGLSRHLAGEDLDRLCGSACEKAQERSIPAEVLDRGFVSVRKAASLLDCTIEDLAGLFEEYRMPVPFDL
jgi:hypothetical protein